jgi:hypothetical protein
MSGQHHRKKHETPVVTAARKADTNQTTVPQHASIASLVNTNIKPEKIHATIAQQALFQKTFVPKNATCPLKDMWRVLQKPVKWPSLSVGVPIVPEQAVTKDAAAPRYVPLVHSKPIVRVPTVLRGNIPRQEVQLVNNARKVNSHPSKVRPVAKNVIRSKTCMPKTKKVYPARAAALEKFQPEKVA